MIKVVSNKEQTATGPLPIMFNSDGTPLDDYKIYGTSEGAGVETENLWDGYLEQGTLGVDGSEVSADNRVRSNYIKVSETGKHTISIRNSKGTLVVVFLYDESKSFIESDVGSWQVIPYTFTLNSPGYIRIIIRWATNYPIIPTDISEIRTLISGSTAPTTYTPYGYKLPMTVESGEESTATPIYIGDSKLMAEEYVDYGEQKIYRKVDNVLTPTDPPVPIPELSTYSGENTLSCSEELGDESQITYVGPVEETITKIMRTEDDGQGNVTEHVLYREGS